MHAPVAALTFDAAGTLFHLTEPVGTTYARFGERFGLSVSADALESSFRKAWREVPELHAETNHQGDDPHEAECRWWRMVVDETFRRAGATQGESSKSDARVSDDLFTALFDHFALPEAWTLYPETISVLKHLSGRFPMVVISNFDRRFREIADGLGISPFFQEVFLSGEIGYAKPSPHIFGAARRALNRAPGSILHCGDDPDADWHGAKLAGFQCFELDRSIRSLEDLIALNSLQ